MIDFSIQKLTELMIKQQINDRKNNKITYIKKVDAYKDLITLLKQIKQMKEEGD